MRLNWSEAEKCMSGDYVYPIGMDDIDRLVELKKILLKYVDDIESEFYAMDQLITVCKYPDCGIEEEDVVRMAELLFLIDDGYIVMYG